MSLMGEQSSVFSLLLWYQVFDLSSLDRTVSTSLPSSPIKVTCPLHLHEVRNNSTAERYKQARRSQFTLGSMHSINSPK